MADMPYFKFYHQDWIAGTSDLSMAERGAYITLVAIMYDIGGPVVRDDARLAKRCGTSVANFRTALNGLLATGKIVEKDGYLTNDRVQKELADYMQTRSVASQNAKSRWDKVKQNQSSKNATASNPQCENDAIQKSEVRNNNNTADDGLAAFAEWAWKTIPKRQSDSRSDFLKRLPMAVKEVGEGKLRAAIEAYRAYHDALPERDKGFVDGASKWLNQKKWENDWTVKPAVTTSRTPSYYAPLI